MRRLSTFSEIALVRWIAAAGIMAAGVATLTASQSYPDKPIRMIVPFAAGGPVDVMARLIGQPLASIIGQSIVVENRGGASGAIGSKLVASADPDGYTLLCGNISSLIVQPIMNRDVETARSFVPIARLSQNVEVLVVNPNFPAQSVQELVAYAKANPNKLNYGSGGQGNISQLAAELFRLRTGVDIVHVPYKGASEVFTGILGGQVHMYFGDIGGMLPLIREGRLKALALSGATRSPELPDLPTMMESGVPGYEVRTFIGVMAPAATPPAIVAKLNAAINQSLQTPDVTATAAKLNADVRPASSQEFGDFLAKEREKWTEVVRLAGIKTE